MPTVNTEWIGPREVGVLLGISESSARRILRKETTGVHRIFTPGSVKPIIRVDPQVVDRILRRSLNRA